MPAERADGAGPLLLREARHAVICRSSRQPSQVPAVPGRKPAARGRRARSLRRRGADAGSQASGPADVGADADGRPDQVAQGGDQRLRLRAGVPQERAAGAFRLHGLRHRRRGHAARQPRRLSQVPAASAPAGRRQQGRHVDRHSRREISEPDRARAGRRPALVPRRGRGRQRARRQGRQPSADSLDRHQHWRRGRHRGARRADLVPALRHQQVGGGRALGQARGEGRLPRGRGHGRSLAAAATRRPCSGCVRATPATARAATTARACRPTCGPGRCIKASTSPA